MATDLQPVIDLPDATTIRNNAILAGGIDPINMRFRVLEYGKSNGALLGVPVEDTGFLDAVETTKALIHSRSESHFLLEPIGFIQ